MFAEADPILPKDAFKPLETRLRVALLNAQYQRLRKAEKTLLVALDARQFDITPTAAPNSDELSRPYLWRFWRHAPRHGRIAIFDRSWYGRVLVERVEKITPEDWRNRDKWKEYATAANEMLARTDVKHAPWHLVSANDKRHARLQVLRHIVEALEKQRSRPRPRPMRSAALRPIARGTSADRAGVIQYRKVLP